MPIDRTRHKNYLSSILIDIYTDKILSRQLAFKGGTSLMFFYELDRFSTDLDFNCLDSKFNANLITLILKSQYKELNFIYTDKYHTHFWLIDTGKGEVNIKIEIRKNDFISPLDTYEIKNLNGVSVKTMTIDCMLAHKLCAACDRRQNRDLYDIWFMLKNGVEIKQSIVITENPIKKDITCIHYLKHLKNHILTNLNQKNVLDDIGNLLYTEAQKDKIRATLIPKLITLIDLEIEKQVE